MGGGSLEVSPAQTPAPAKSWRVLLSGTGGGSGVTRFLVDAATMHKRRGVFEPLVVFRRKKDPIGEQFTNDLRAAGVRWNEVRAAPKFLTIVQLRRHIRAFRPDVFVVHGHSDHIWGRMAAIRERVPVIIMVEQNIERYIWLQRVRSVALAKKTDAIVAVSHGVGEHLAVLGHPRGKIRVIHNGARVERLAAAAEAPLDSREPAVLMAARFARQKDHGTLLRAVALLRDGGAPVRVRLAGGGSRRHEKRARSLAAELRLGEWVEFLGPRSDVPDLLARHRVFVISTHYEGLCIAAVEAMAAGCATVGTRAVGVTDLIEHGKTGWLAEPGDPESLAAGIKAALGVDAVTCAKAGRDFATRNFSMEKVVANYEALFEELLAAKTKNSAQRNGAEAS